jgi:hypothetical protein
MATVIGLDLIITVKFGESVQTRSIIHRNTCTNKVTSKQEETPNKIQPNMMMMMMIVVCSL